MSESCFERARLFVNGVAGNSHFVAQEAKWKMGGKCNPYSSSLVGPQLTPAPRPGTTQYSPCVVEC